VRHHRVVAICLLAGAAVLPLAGPLLLGIGYECMLHRLTGLNCPFCGMTRDFVTLSQGNASFLNPGSPVLAALLFAVYPATVTWASVRGTHFPLSARTLRRWLIPAMSVMFIANNLPKG
jgi:hypothetical protein